MRTKCPNQYYQISGRLVGLLITFPHTVYVYFQSEPNGVTKRNIISFKFVQVIYCHSHVLQK